MIGKKPPSYFSFAIEDDEVREIYEQDIQRGVHKESIPSNMHIFSLYTKKELYALNNIRDWVYRLELG